MNLPHQQLIMFIILMVDLRHVHNQIDALFKVNGVT